MNEDLISRQVAIDAIENTSVELSSNEWDELTDAIMSVKSADISEQLKPKWIPCSERLPEPNVYVLMTTAWGSVTIGERIYPTINNTVYFIHDGTTNAELDDVVAWCKLPEPYRGESE